MTLKQQMAINNLVKNNFNVSKSLREAGYTPQSANAGCTHKRIRNIMNKLDFFSPEKIKQDIANTRRLAKKSKDITNLNRIDEHRSKIAGMIKEKIENTGPAEKVIIVYGSKPVDNSVDKKL